MSELYHKGLFSKDDLHRLPYHYPYMMRHSSTHWLDSLVHIQSRKSADVHARTFDTLRRYSLRRYSLTEVGKEGQTKPTGVTVHYFHLYACWLKGVCLCALGQVFGNKPMHRLVEDVFAKHSTLSKLFIWGTS